MQIAGTASVRPLYMSRLLTGSSQRSHPQSDMRCMQLCPVACVRRVPEGACMLQVPRPAHFLRPLRNGQLHVRVAVARDAAFSFYYHE